jgi:hypothetical protein
MYYIKTIIRKRIRIDKRLVDTMTWLASMTKVMSARRANDTTIMGQFGQDVDTRVADTLMPNRR